MTERPLIVGEPPRFDFLLPRTDDPELLAIAVIVDAFAELDPSVTTRILIWAWDRYIADAPHP